MPKFIDKNKNEYELSHIENIKDIKIGDIVVISNAHKYEYGYWSCFSDTVYQFIGRKADEYQFIDVIYTNTLFTMTDMIDTDRCHAFIKGKMIDKVYLRNLKLKKLLKEKPST